MASIDLANLSEIAPRSSDKFAIAIMGITIVVPIYSFVGAKRGVVLPVFG